ncbi:ExeM/NucH family extracellular endonuclease [uncultured Serinicoccus sp.]|uniref:ExeM/NucH family extracellular endonuclease n=1 Tax=uncultured Serinicoccus sp. TaxID=735514 RepID=UPI0026183D6E|nr:ExeM/NucH family extracellular endonuclease [uncultured Serinicoccus sp.]
MQNVPRRAVAAASTAALAVTGLVALSPAALAAGPGLVIDEVYGGGGNSGAVYTHDFVELVNSTEASIDLDGYAVSYYSSSGNLGDSCDLTGTVEPGASFLVQQNPGSGGTTPLPDPDIECGASMSGSNGIVELTLDDEVVDLVGYGSATRFEGSAAAPGLSNTTSASRTDAVDTDDNAADFTQGEPTPNGSGGGTDPDPEPDPEPVDATIAQIQGTGATSPLEGGQVNTTGVVTAAYPTGGFSGVYLQTPGSGGVAKAPGDASDGVFLYSSWAADNLEIGDCVEVEAGEVVEFNGMTEISGGFVTAVDGCDAVSPTTLDTLPVTEEEKEVYEGMLVQPEGTYTITNNYQLNQYGQIGLALGDEPLYQATDQVLPGEEAEAYEAANQEKYITLDDGSSWDYLRNETAQGSALPYLSAQEPHRTGSQVSFTAPVILDYRFQWNYQPVSQVVGSDSPVDPISSEDDREYAAPEVGGDLQVGAFNVLNYFSDLGQDEEGCDFYADRFGNPVATDFCEVRGAWSEQAFADQQAKLVTAINGTDAEVLALMEIENSAALSYIDHPRDKAVADLVAALNEDAGEERWAYAPSPAVTPPNEDVIRTAFIYDPEVVSLDGPSLIQLDDAFANARYPLAQGFTTDDGLSFVAVANHFKSKGSGEDDGTGQGLANPSRIAQAEALTEWSEEMFADEAVFLMGDFNAYSREDPVRVIEDAGYTNLARAAEPDSASYQFSGRLGSLDHVFANEAADAMVTGAGVWDINGDESIAFQYSRRNYNLVDFHSDDQFASSDHDPVLAGLSAGTDEVVPVDRISGTNRYDTAAKIAAAYPEGVDTVYVATGEGFADALSGAAPAARGIVPSTTGEVAVAPDGSPAPVLLTKTATLPSATIGALGDLEPANIVILGGEVAVSEDVEEALEGYGEVTRVSGKDRFETSALLAAQYGEVDHVYVATGENGAFADALSVSSLAATEGVPVLLTRGDSVPASLATALETLGDPEVTVLGGEGAVDDEVFTALGATDRLAGTNRYGTSVAVAERFGYDESDPAPVVHVATGLDYPDALAGSALAGYQQVPVMLSRTGEVPGSVLEAIVAVDPVQVFLLGGTTALSEEVRDTLVAALNGDEMR